MFNIDYKESEHIKEVREKYLEKIKELPNKSFEDFGDFIDKLNYSIEEQTDSEEAYIYIWLFTRSKRHYDSNWSWVSFRVCNRCSNELLEKIKIESYKGSFFLREINM